MIEKFKILAKYIKDVSSETPDVETFLFVKENISKYQLNVDIKTKPLKNQLIEINITFTYMDKEANEKKSYFEMTYSVIIRLDKSVKEKKELEKIVLCDVPTIVYPDLEKAFLNLLHHSGHQGIRFEKKVDFNKLFSERIN